MNAPRLGSRFAFLALLLLAACPPSASPEEAPALGRKTAPITNGVADDTPSHSAVVAMKQGRDFACSGTLISPRVVLTAAHCVVGTSASGMTIGFGDDVSSPSMVWVRVSEIQHHPDYNDSSLANDIGLVRLASSAPAGIAPIPFLPSSLALTSASAGTAVEFSGFGQTETGSYGIKLKVSDTLDLVCETSGARCAWAGSSAPNHTLCYDQQPGGPCSGDSGGPAFVTVGDTEYVVGVTSYGDMACETDGCSTDATAFEDWIKAFIGDVGPNADGQACTAANQCQSGFCVDGVCCNLACDSGCTACSLAAGASADGVCTPVDADCDDGNPCTTGDQCVAGHCVGSQVHCPAADQCHLTATCDRATGLCGAPLPRADGTACDDADECTTGDHCLSGTCTGTARATCPAPSPCQADAVCADGTCGEYLPRAEGEGCDDGDACTTGDVCLAGACTGQAVSCPRTPCRGWGACDPATGGCLLGAPLAEGTACDDGNGCTSGDHCSKGECVGTLETGACPAPDGCHAAGTCTADGTCQAAALADGTACEEGDLCTTGDTCQGGVCVAGGPRACTPPDACHLGGTCEAATGTCTFTAAAAGTACDDGNACTEGDACSGLTCTGTARQCPAAGECQTGGTCVAATGQCSYDAVADGTACSDGECKAGVCESKGCGCSTGGQPMALLAALAAFGALARRRR